MASATRTEALPSNAWGDATFHLAHVERSLEAAVHEAVTSDERQLAARMRRAINNARQHTLTRAHARAGEQEAMRP